MSSPTTSSITSRYVRSFIRLWDVIQETIFKFQTQRLSDCAIELRALECRKCVLFSLPSKCQQLAHLAADAAS